MSRKVNIPQFNPDPFYRYQRDIIQTTPGKANTTIINNLQTIADQIYRSPTEISHYLKKKTGTNVFIKNGETTLKGTFTGEKLDKLIEEYIETHVLCGVCGNPETFVDDKKKICKACGSIL